MDNNDNQYVDDSSILDGYDGLLPVIPVMDIVAYPHLIVPIFIARKVSVAALSYANIRKTDLIISLQRDAKVESPSNEDVHEFCTVVKIKQVIKFPDGVTKIIVKGVSRCRIVASHMSDAGCIVASYDLLESYNDNDVESRAMMRVLSDKLSEYIKISKSVQSELHTHVKAVDDPGRFSDIVSLYLLNNIKARQELLEELNVYARLEKIYEIINPEIEIIGAENRIKNRVRGQIEKHQKEHYLSEQLKAIQKELGNDADSYSDIPSLEKKLKSVKMPKDAKQRAEIEIRKLKSMNSFSSEANIARNYINFILSLPWGKYAKQEYCLEKARNALDKYHYGLQDIKERIMEFIAAQKRSSKNLGLVLCFVGPPGIGKTSLSKSIAEAMGRDFASVSLGGMRDESEIKGHRRAYVGAMPGRILQAVRRAGTSNPVILLDEIDKMASDWRGDTSATLLEILDPVQSSGFSDYYLEIEYDLSSVLFIATANSLNIPSPLRDRLEIVRLESYSEEDKIHIAKSYLIPEQMAKYNVSNKDFCITNSALVRIIRNYTMEAGVRDLDRTIAAIIRKAIFTIEKKDIKKFDVNLRNIDKILSKKFRKQPVQNKVDSIGISNGLAWTEHGGEILNIESVVFPGSGKITATGALGDVMKESFKAAEFFIKSNMERLNIGHDFFNTHNMHIHVPEGATPKDGPSAGCAVAISMLSTVMKKRLLCNVAMTGEITLMGRVLAVGGIKDKVLAAVRNDMRKVLVPESNKFDILLIPKKSIEGIEVCYCSSIYDAIKHAFVDGYYEKEKLTYLGGIDTTISEQENAICNS